MCDLSSVLPTSSSTGSTTTSGGTTTSGAATCCPAATIFHDRGLRRSDYFGFDDKTDLAPAASSNYWVTTPGSAPGNRETRDGAVWLSVQSGQTTKAKIRFTSNVGCIGNCTYEVRPSSKATVLSSSITANNATFEIQGNSAGEASVVVVCNGNDIGWVHVAVYDALNFNVGMAKINQNVTTGSGASARTALALPNPAMNISSYQSFMTDCWRDSVTDVTLNSLATYNVPTSVASLIASGGFWDSNGTMESSYFRANASTRVYPVTDAIYNAVRRANPGHDKYLFLMPQPGTRAAGTSYINGFARGIGGNYAIFFNVGSGTQSTAAHEFGHMVNLRHPNDRNATSQFPQHLRAPRTTSSRTNNVAVNDPLNLMGYGSPRPQRKRLRLNQWKSISGR